MFVSKFRFGGYNGCGLPSSHAPLTRKLINKVKKLTETYRLGSRGNKDLKPPFFRHSIKNRVFPKVGILPPPPHKKCTWLHQGINLA